MRTFTIRNNNKHNQVRYAIIDAEREDEAVKKLFEKFPDAKNITFVNSKDIISLYPCARIK